MSVSLKSDELSYRQSWSKYKFRVDSPEEEDSPKIRFLYHKVLKHMKLSDRNWPAKPEALSPSTEAKWAVLLNLVIQNGALLMNTTDTETAETKTIYILPGSDRDDTYSNQDYIRLVRNLVKRIKRQERFNARQHD